MHGSEMIAKDCVDFIIFEKYLSDTLGRWRLHSKVKSRSAADYLVKRTLRLPTEEITDSHTDSVAAASRSSK